MLESRLLKCELHGCILTGKENQKRFKTDGRKGGGGEREKKLRMKGKSRERQTDIQRER